MLEWEQLALLPEAELGSRDLAATHLACAEGLPGWELIDRTRCLGWLDYAAGRVRGYTERAIPDFVQSPDNYNHSEAYFRALCLITVLQRDLHVRYNPAKIPDDAPFDTADTFIHGALFGDGGTCATMPVIYTAVGRRLGYPIRLVEAPHHLLTRWDDPNGERFNLEATAKGLNCFPDDYYRTGRYAITPEREKESRFLQSQTPREELGGFLAQRAFRWLDIGNLRESCYSFIHASILAPEHRVHGSCVVSVLRKWHKQLKASLPRSFPDLIVRFTSRRWPTIPPFVEYGFRTWDFVETCLRDPKLNSKWWESLRRNPFNRPYDLPECMEVVFTNGVSPEGQHHVRSNGRPLA
jgi:hypothetical protein